MLLALLHVLCDVVLPFWIAKRPSVICAFVNYVTNLFAVKDISRVVQGISIHVIHAYCDHSPHTKSKTSFLAGGSTHL